jgi:hypothetical protein
VSRPSSLTIVFTAPIAAASSWTRSSSGSTASLCGMVTPQPRIPSARIAATAASVSSRLKAT